MAVDNSPPPANSGLIIPIIIWGPTPPSSTITYIKYLTDRSTIITGSENGHVLVWKCAEDSLSPHLLMIGHNSAVSVVSATSCSLTSTRFISASVDGTLCLWDIQDGRCVDTITSTNIHRYMEPYTYKSSRHTRQTRLFCIGDYSDFIIMDPQDLTVVYNLSSRVEPEWIQSYCIISRSSKSDQCIGLTSAGMIKVWTLTDLDKRDMGNPVYEDESRRLDLRNVKTTSFNPINERLLLLVASNSWHILDIEDFSVMFSMKCSLPAVTGQVIDVDKIAIGFEDQTLRIYQLPLTRLRGTQVTARFGSSPSNYLNQTEPFEIANLEGNKNGIMWVSDVVFAFARRPGVDDQYQVIKANREGRLLLWRIPNFDPDFMKTFHSISQLPLKYKGTFEQSLQAVWNSLNENKEDLMPVLDTLNVTCSLLVASKGKLILGRKDGLITMAYACDALSRQLLDTGKEATTVRKLYGHKGSVKCLFYPHDHHCRFDSSVLLSGGDDFAVIAWNIQTGSKLYKFTVHGGPILRFLIPPANCSKLISKCVCVVAQDHSVSLLNIRDMKCCLLASRHPYPVKEVRWRPLDDFMLVRLDDGSVYVWQMETANIDRIVTGLMAEEVLMACEEQIGREEGTDETAASSAIQLMRALKHKNMDAAKQTVKSSDTEKILLQPMTLEVGSPFTVTALPGCSTGAHVVQFEVSALISGLINVDFQGDNLDEENSPNGFSKRIEWQNEAGLYVDIARLMLSLLHAWNLDKELDALCIKKLGLSRPKHQLYFGNVSRQGQLIVVLPQSAPRSFETFSFDVRWQASHSLTTNHLLAVIATANTLMNMRKIVSSHAVRRLSTVPATEQPNPHMDAGILERQQIHQCWSLLAALHCVLLPDQVRPKSSYAAPRIELLARRWQDSSMEIRTAAQALLIRELSRLDTLGRRRLIESWAPFLPPLLDSELSIFGARLQSSVPSLPPNAPPIPPRSKHSPPPMAPVIEPTSNEEGESGIQQVRRNQATAIILLGVVGAEFGDELNRADLTRATALSLLELLVAAPSNLLPVNSPLRRAAIDLLGKGFAHWEPHLEISKVLLGLLDLAANAERHLHPSVVVPGAPLSPLADACRTARSALSLIAAARPPALLNALSVEVARYNSAAQHQTIQHTVVSPLLKSRAEVLRIIEELAEKKYNEVVERMLPVGEVLVHCLDTTMLKHKQLAEIFPPITKFSMVAYCPSSRRIAFGGVNGNVIVHELRAAKSHNLQSHHGPVAACAFSEDGKYLATYGSSDAKVNFWQTTQSFLGMGQSSMKLVKSQPAPGATMMNSPMGQSFRPKLVWINSKSLTLMLAGGREQRFTL